jgi:hypothetical protein
MTKVTLLGIDLAKNIFQLHGADASGKAVWNSLQTFPHAELQWKRVVAQVTGQEHLKN